MKSCGALSYMYWAVLSYSAVFSAVQGVFCLLSPFRGKLLSGSFLVYCAVRVQGGPTIDGHG